MSYRVHRRRVLPEHRQCIRHRQRLREAAAITSTPTTKPAIATEAATTATTFTATATFAQAAATFTAAFAAAATSSVVTSGSMDATYSASRTALAGRLATGRASSRRVKMSPLGFPATSFMYSSSILMLFLACATACFVGFRRRVQGMEDKERELRSQWNARTSNEQDEDEPTRSRSTKRDKPKRATKMPTKGGRTLVPNYDPMEEGCDPMESSGGCCPTGFEQLPSSSSSRSKKGKRQV